MKRAGDAVAARVRALAGVRGRPRLRAAERAGAGRVQGSAARPATRSGCRPRRPTRSTRGDWWRLFGDPELDRLAAEVDAANQTVAAAVASYTQAQALVRGTRAALLPRASALDASGRRFGGGNGCGSAGPPAPPTPSPPRSTATGRPTSGAASARSVEGARAGEQAAPPTSPRRACRRRARWRSTTSRCARPTSRSTCWRARSRATSARCRSRRTATPPASSPKTDVLQAQTQLLTTRASLATVRANRERFEHAIAVLTGKAPGDFALAPAPWSERVPAIPLGVPSALLQRRPDIASAERQVAAANAQIGVAAVGVLPEPDAERVDRHARACASAISSTPPARSGRSASRSRRPCSTPARSARASTPPSAAHEVAVARYRQTVLDRVPGRRGPAQPTRARRPSRPTLLKQASDAADQTEQQILNRYRAGQLSYTDVVTAQASALSARRALVQVGRQPPGDARSP